ncbi:ankyrin repeat domain-containing protein [Streptomyces sp. NPDC002073]|uniref:ankyrin repeat domain-containing protein n=1 Tax=Streptomyces sp. NBC_00239 TaxID=2903640 RepID=UPI002E2C4D76|nr:ankyrin repeat domain-containing protein [Streptomyces sp. NBC_00239]
MMMGMDEDQGLSRESRQGWTQLHFAADEQDAAAVGSLLAEGAEVDAPDGQGNTPLWQAVFTYRGDGAVLSLLVKAGADPDRVNLHGVSPRRLAGWRVGSDVVMHLGERPSL